MVMDKNERVEQLTQALMFALLTANEQPYPLALPAAQKVAALMDDCGVRQTGEKAAEITLPGWITERVREESAPVPVEPDHHAPQPTPRVAKAPKPPKRIAKSKLGVIK